jgi:hypothetical protein
VPPNVLNAVTTLMIVTTTAYPQNQGDPVLKTVDVIDRDAQQSHNDRKKCASVEICV